MAQIVRTSQQSFGGGILAPELYGRLDLAKYPIGLAECTNFIISPHGPADSRAGSEFIKETKDSSKQSRLIEFIFNTDQAYALEFGDQYMRVHTEGGTLLEASQNITGATSANPVELTIAGHGYSTGDEVYLDALPGDFAALNGKYHTITVTGANTFTVAIDGSAFAAYTAGGTAARVFTLVTPYLEADLFELDYVQSEDVLTITHPNYAPREITRVSATSWIIGLVTFGPNIAAPGTPAAAIGAGSGTNRYQYVVTAISSTLEESLISAEALFATVYAISGITLANPGVFTTTAAHGLAVDDLVYIDTTGIVGMPELQAGYYYVDSIPLTTTFTLRTLAGVVLDTSGFTAYTSGATMQHAFVLNDLSVAGNSNQITWPNVSGAIRYNVYKADNGLYGYIGQALDGLIGFTDDNIAPDMLTSPPQDRTPFTGAGDYPSTATYFEQRRIFAGPDNSPQGVWMTRSGTEGNLSYSVPSRADDAIVFNLKSRQLNRIQHMVPMTDLLLLTNAGEWIVTAKNSDAITPTTLWARPQGYTGANKLQPIIARESVIFAQAQGSHFADMKFDLNQNVYKSRDMSVLAPHLFDGFTFSDWCYVRAPYPILWAVRSDGKLVACTYLPEQEVLAFHLHESTNGVFESVCAIPEGNQDRIYAVARRTINAVTKRYIERISARVAEPIEDAFFVDCGLSYSGAPITVITGLDHLEGQTVSILADGFVRPQAVVSGGQITLATSASKIHIGLPITAQITTLPLIFQIPGLGQGMDKEVLRLFLKVEASRGIKAGTDTAHLTEFVERLQSTYGAAGAPISAELEIGLDSEWKREPQLIVQVTDPVPATILSMSAEVAIGV